MRRPGREHHACLGPYGLIPGPSQTCLPMRRRAELEPNLLSNPRRMWFPASMRWISALTTAGLVTALTVPAVLAYADPSATPPSEPPVSASPSPSVDTSTSPEPTPTPDAPTTPSVPIPSTSTSPTPAASTTPVPTLPTPTPTLSTPAPAQPSASTRVDERRATATPPLTLTVSAGGTPVKGRYFEDIGFFALRGVIDEARAGQKVETWWYQTGTKKWVRSGRTTTIADGRWGFNQPVGHPQKGLRLVATLGGAPGAKGVLSSAEVRVDVANATLTQTKPVTSVNSLKNPKVSGTVSPARAGVKISIDVLRSDKYTSSATATTDALGRYSATFTYGKGHLTTYRVRSSYQAANRKRTETSSSHTIKRTAVLDATIAKTTSADVAKTYRKGCPVGPSKLRTVSMNYYGRDRLMHRGVIVIRTDLVTETVRAFGAGLDARFPIAKMDNPNVYGGNDPKQMAANNTSGFNCRKVVGNPYAQSPHSYGIAIDITPVQNPYRDANGKWWPTNGKSYIDRSPRRFGMLTKNSYITKQLRKDGFFWGGFWSPGRDYQHFQYDR